MPSLKLSFSSSTERERKRESGKNELKADRIQLACNLIFHFSRMNLNERK